MQYCCRISCPTFQYLYITEWIHFEQWTSQKYLFTKQVHNEKQQLDQTQAKFCTGSLIVMNPNLTIFLSQKSKVPHKVRSLLTGDLIMRASHRHPLSAFTQFCKHVNPLSPVGLFLTWRQDQVQEINPSHLCVLQNRYYTFIALTNELFILCFVPMLFLSTAQWWHRGFYTSKFCTTHLPKIYKIQKNGLELSQSTLENERGNLRSFQAISEMLT